MSGDPAARGGKRVLVVDDDEGLARSCARLLRRHCRVECAYSVETALVVIHDGGTLDAVWSDRHMPHASAGAEVLRAAAEAHPGAILMMVTGDPPAPASEDVPAGVQVFDKDQGLQRVLDWLLARLAR